MNEDNDLFPEFAAGEAFDVQRRGYSRQQVDEFVAWCRHRLDELRDGLSRSADEKERLRDEVAVLRRQAAGKPDHAEVGERIAQILKLADDEARARRERAQQDTATLRDTTQRDVDRMREQAKAHSERMLTAAQEQAERAITSARSEAEKLRSEAEKARIASRAEAARTAADARKKAESVLATADAHAKRTVDEATARAATVLAEAERRLNLLGARHAETVRRLTEIRDDVAALLGSAAAQPAHTADLAVDAHRGPAPATAGAPSGGTGDGTGHADETVTLSAHTAGSPYRPGQHETAAPPGGSRRPDGSHRAEGPGDPASDRQRDATWPQRVVRGDEPPPGADRADRTADGRSAGPSGAGNRERNAAAPGVAGDGDGNPGGASGGPASLSGTIDPDEPTEGVRVISG